MIAIRRVLNSLALFWALLAIPAAALLVGFARGEIIAMDMLHPTGELSARFMIAAMAIGPLLAILGRRGWLLWLLKRRRSLGVAAFAYALLHLVFYIIDMEALDAMLAELGAPGIWTGWLALLLMLPLGATSNEAAVRALRAGWKKLQRLVYPVALLTLAHWLLVHNAIGPALAHFIPLALLEAARAAVVFRRRSSRGAAIPVASA